MKSYLRIVGITTDNRLVVAGLFKLYDEKGLPFDVIFEALLTQNIQPCWLSLYVEAENAGWKPSKIASTIEAGLRDAGHHAMATRVAATLGAATAP